MALLLPSMHTHLHLLCMLTVNSCMLTVNSCFSRNIPGLCGQESSTVILDGQTVELSKTATALYRLSYAQVFAMVALAKKGVPVCNHGIVFKS